MMTYEDQIYTLKTAEFAADGDECVRRDDASRIASKADAEVAKLRAENERLNDLAWRYRGELNQAQEEFAKLKYERLPAIKAALEDLKALLPAKNLSPRAGEIRPAALGSEAKRNGDGRAP